MGTVPQGGALRSPMGLEGGTSRRANKGVQGCVEGNEPPPFTSQDKYQGLSPGRGRGVVSVLPGFARHRTVTCVSLRVTPSLANALKTPMWRGSHSRSVPHLHIRVYSPLSTPHLPARTARQVSLCTHARPLPCVPPPTPCGHALLCRRPAA